MPKKTSKRRRILSPIICLIFALGIVLSLSGGTAEARRSLANIERIKKQGGALRILEILPDGSEGSIGYLIAGQEPIGDWVKKAASLASPQERKAYVDELIDNLSGAGLLGTGDAAPLENLGGNGGKYTEYFPWTKPEGEVFTLELDKTETATNVSGRFTYAEGGDGAYEFTGGYELVSNGGTHIQNIAYFSSTKPDDGGVYYWYKLTFTEVTDWSKVSLGTAIYENTGNYVYSGTYGLDFESPTPGVKYYTAAPTDIPSKTKTSTKPYAAIANGFIPAPEGQTGYFKQEQSSYHYVEFGGDYNYSTAGSGKHTISYDKVYYTGGIKNNEWFLRHVLDWEEGEERPQAALSVSSISAKELTTGYIEAAKFNVMI